MTRRFPCLVALVLLLVPRMGSTALQDGPLVLRTLPPDGLHGVPINAEIRVYFDREMNLETFYGNFTIRRQQGGDLIEWTGRLEGRGNTVFVAKPTTDLPPGNKQINVLLNHGITDIEGNPIEDQNGEESGAYNFNFVTGDHTDTEAPELFNADVHPNPTNGAVELTVSVEADDTYRGGSIIGAGEFFVEQVGMNGRGIPLNPVDPPFDDSVEVLKGEIDASGWELGKTYAVFVHAMDVVGNWTYPFETILVYTEGVEYLDPELVYAWPNPASDQVTFTFTVGGESYVKLVVYDQAGREVHRDSGVFDTGYKGEFVWDLAGAASDVYVFQILAEETSGQFRRQASVVKKLAVIR